MKSSDRKTYCPICNQQVSADFLKHHIAQIARRERADSLQTTKKHNEFIYSSAIMDKGRIYKDNN